MRWLKEKLNYGKRLSYKELNDKDDSEENVSSEEEEKFKQWYMHKFKEELKADCFTSFLNGDKLE